MKRCGDRVGRIFGALGSDARLCIVRRLGEEDEICVCDLVGCCGLGWSTVSHHLSVLKEAGIVNDEKRGQQVYYRLALTCVTDFIRCLESGECPVDEGETLSSVGSRGGNGEATNARIGAG